jgi:DNA-directed RNA polymerase specialized sigma24 family protein
MSVFADSQATERRFDEIFHHLGAVVSYARRRGASDPEGIAADVMATAWKRLPDVPDGDPAPRPWLFSTARNLVFADWRRGERERTALTQSGADHIQEPPAPALDLDPVAARLGPRTHGTADRSGRKDDVPRRRDRTGARDQRSRLRLRAPNHLIQPGRVTRSLSDRQSRTLIPHGVASLRLARSGFRHFLGRCRSNSRAATSASLPQQA